MNHAPSYPAPAAALKLHWWKARPNFGDALSALVVAHVAGRPVTHAGPGGAELFALGSLLQVVRRRHRGPRADGLRPWIWGSGLLHPVPADFLDNVRIALLRGPITAALLGVAADRFGDPGLLVPEVLGLSPASRDRIALVPHHSQMEDPGLRALAEREPALDLIDVRGDPAEICTRIGTARHVIAASLHGLIVADAYGVPNTWLAPGDQSRLKYHDYAAGVGRPLIAPLTPEAVPDLLRRIKDSDRITYEHGLAQARAALQETFPQALRGADPALAQRPGA